jgi:hypothetical protein
MSQAKIGNLAIIEFKTKYSDESFFSQPRYFQFTIGRKTIDAWLSQATNGMKIGESKMFKLPANKIMGSSFNANPNLSDIEIILKLIGLQFTRTDILNYLIKTYNFKSYMEIGIEYPENNFNYIEIENKIGVDPNPKGDCDYVMTSDMFFESYCGNRRFDLIFIDGLHLEEQVTRDFHNSLDHLNEGGIIALHDCNPTNEVKQFERQISEGCAWNGTCWKTFVELRMTRPDLQMHCVDCDEGCAIIKRGEQEIYTKITLEQAKQYLYLDLNRKELLNLITFEQFKEIYKY